MSASEILERYGDFRPTRFDARGLGAHRMGHDDDDSDRSDWLLVPVSQTRDSGTLERSNYASALAALEEIDTDGDDFEEHRFGHWGPGWFEIIIVRPGSKEQKVAEDIASALADYPVLNDEDHSERETESELEDWHQYAREDFIKEMLEAHPALECETCEGSGWDYDDAYRPALDNARELWDLVARENRMQNYGISCDLTPILARVDYFRSLYMRGCETCKGEGNHLAYVDSDALLYFARSNEFIREYYSESGFYFDCEGYKRDGEWDAESIREALRESENPSES